MRERIKTARHAEPETQITVTSTMLKEIVWEALIEDTRMSIEEIQDAIESKTGKRTGSVVLIGNLRSEFRMILQISESPRAVEPRYQDMTIAR